MAAVSPEYAHQTKGPRILAVFWAMTSLAILAVAARLFIRIKVLRNPGADDWLIAASMVFSISYSVVTTVDVALGYGKHAIVIADRLELVLLVNYINFALGIISFALPKLAVAALLSRFLNPTTIQRAILWGLTGFVALVSCICILVLFTMCDPARALWDTSLLSKGAHCRSSWILVDYAIFTGAVSAFTDLYLAIYPTIILLKLNMSLRKRLALCTALGLSAVACAMAIIKCMQLPGLADLSDTTYATADLVIWTSIESNVVILASCIPTLQPLLEIILGKRSLRSTSRYQYKESSAQLPESNKWSSKRSAHRKSKGNMMVADVGSQDSILQTVNDHGDESHYMGHIRRTDNITIVYESVTPHSGGADNTNYHVK
ncbi:PAXNEB family protein [Aspergillus tubingensis]|nr:PAXNEB family protein [Aspergillus tubingensis]GFN15408.1 PAXNEB family protein [Aspergillus tubingensis]